MLTMQDRFVKLPDGRQLGYAEYGASNGSPVLFFHGAPGSRYVHADLAGVAAKRGIRLIAVERPGYGLSSPQPGRTMLDWPNDIAVLTDALALKRFAIIGFSGGSPYALACAFLHPDRVPRLALAGALAPQSVPSVMDGMSPSVSGLYALAQANPVELKNTFAAIAPSASALLDAMCASATEWDRNMIEARRSEFEAEYEQTLRCGVEGVASDFVLASGNWGFPLEGIKAEIHLWSGTADQNTPPAMTTYLSSHLPNSRSFILPGEGHFVLYPHWEEILERLI